MRSVVLREYQRTPLDGVSRAEAIALANVVAGMRIEPTACGSDAFDAVPGSTVGAVRLGDLSIIIRPKVELHRVLFLVSYAVDPSSWRETPMEFAPDDSVVEAIAPAFARLVARATSRGLLYGYRSRDESLSTVRGRIRFGDQVRLRHGLMPPIEVTQDEFTCDIDENRLLRAAMHALSSMRLKSPAIVRMLRELAAAFDGVSLIVQDTRGLTVPSITRLNSHYEPAMRLASLILRGTAFELGTGGASGTAFLLDMNEVFESFVHLALAEALGLSTTAFRRGNKGVHLDEDSRVGLEPDLTWWEGGRCVFVGDVKYKRLDMAGFKHADLFQLLAYTTATQLNSGMLVYAASEAEPRSHRVRFADKMLHIAALDLEGEPDAILAQIGELAGRIRRSATSTRATP